MQQYALPAKIAEAHGRAIVKGWEDEIGEGLADFDGGEAGWFVGSNRVDRPDCGSQYSEGHQEDT